MQKRAFEYDAERKKILFSRDLEKFVERKRNIDMLVFVRQFTRVHSVNKADDNGMTLLHLAAKHNNVEMIRFLVRLGCDINSQNVQRQTPLVTAIYYSNFSAIKNLVESNADIWVDGHNEPVMQLLINRKAILSVSTLTRFMRNLNQRYGNDLEMLTGLLTRVHCPLLYIVYAGDEHLTQAMLNRPDYQFTVDEGYDALQQSLMANDLPNMRVLWRSMRMIQSRSKMLAELRGIDRLCDLWAYVMPLFQHLAEWAVIDDEFLFFLTSIFTYASQYELEILLHQCDVDVQLRKNNQIELLPLLLINTNLDSENVIDLAYKRHVKLDVVISGGMSALHYAAITNSTERLGLLLELGANCNVNNHRNLVPLCYASNRKCVELLLLHGTNIHIIDVRGETVLEQWLCRTQRGQTAIVKLLLAQLAVDSYFGVQVSKNAIRKINRRIKFKNHYEMLIRQVQDFMTREILPSLTWHSILKTPAKVMANRIDTLELVTTVKQWCSEQSLDPYFSSLMELYLKKAYYAGRAKYGMSVIFTHVTAKPICRDHLIIDVMCDFLSFKDMEFLASTFNSNDD